MNECILIGRLTKDSEMRTTTSGTIVTTFTLAVNRNFKNSDGEIEADFINCIAFNKTAEVINKYTKKGSQIAINGRLQTSSYDAQDGTKRYKTEVIVSEVKLLDSIEKKDINNMTNSQIVQSVLNDEHLNSIEFTDDDLPF